MYVTAGISCPARQTSVDSVVTQGQCVQTILGCAHVEKSIFCLRTTISALIAEASSSMKQGWIHK